jgi:hypothetical protein
MFCNRCGTQLQPAYRVCPQCGLPVSEPGVVRPTGLCGNRLARHIHTLGILWICAGVLWLIPSLAFLGLSRGMDVADHWRFPFGSPFALPFMFSLGSGFLLVAAAGICVGWGLMQREHWARIVAIVVGILVIFHPPFGTILGIYTLWVLLSNGAAAEYERISR